MDIGQTADMILAVIRIRIVMIIHGVCQETQGIEGGGTVEIVGRLIQTAGMSQGVAPVVDDTIKADLIVADLIVVGSVRVG